MTTYPSALEYLRATQTPASVFTVKQLQGAEFAEGGFGLPLIIQGRSAVVFKATVGSEAKAVRCYTRDNASNRDRYAALGAYLADHDLSPYVSRTEWLDSAIRTLGETWPVVLMDWIEGRNLNEYVGFLADNSNVAAIATLAQRWRELVHTLQQAEFAHGDLQQGDVLVDQEGQLRLVDYDAVWVPQLADMGRPSESGHPNYEHPDGRVWGRWMDTFPALVIYVALVALAKRPDLWVEFNDGDNLLFSRLDFLPPFETKVWRSLAALHDLEVDDLIRLLQGCCSPHWVATQSLEVLLGGTAQPLQASAGSRSYQQRISRRNPGCVVFLCDRSGSMQQSWGDRQQTMAQGVTDAINKILLELVLVSQVGPGKARHLFDVGVFGYGLRPASGGEGVESALTGRLAGRSIVGIPELGDNPIALREMPSPDAGTPSLKLPIWIEPAAGYRTPMCQAIAVAGQHVYDWVTEHPDSFPPIVINITDGMVTDSPYEGATLETWVERLLSLQTSDGPLLLFNIFLSRSATGNVLFPATDNGLPTSGSELFKVSSRLPEIMVGNAISAGMPIDPGARGFGFNASPEMLARFLQIGTQIEIQK